MSEKYRVGTVIANTQSDEWNPYVLTKQGWLELSADDTFPTREAGALSWLEDEDWAIIYRGQEGESAGTDAVSD